MLPEPAPLAPVRPVERADLPALRAVIAATGLFPPDLLDGMMAGYLARTADCQDVWLTFDEAEPAGIAYCAPEAMTEGTWNLYLIAVHPSHQGLGRGSALLARLEDGLRADAGRILLVETSALPAFAPTRAFYAARGFRHEATLRDFYRAGEDKVVFTKRLTPPGAADV